MFNIQNLLIKLKQWDKKIKQNLITLYIAYIHPEVPLYIKLFIFMILIYALSPIDLIPDIIPIIGYIDDLLIVPLGILLVLKLMPNQLIDQCQELALELNIKKLPKSRLGGLLIILLWFFSLTVIYIIFIR